MKRLSLLLFALCPVLLFAQNPNFGPLVDIECGESTVQQPDNWQLYHTLDNTWNGEHDPEWCIHVALGTTTYLELEPGSFEIGRPVFVQLNQAESMPITTNDLYRFWTEGNTAMDFENTDFIEDGWASGIAVEISYPGDDASGTAPYSIWHDANFSEDPFWGGQTAANCVATSEFEGAAVSLLVFKLIYLETGTPWIGQAVCDVVWDFQTISNDNAPNYINGSSLNIYDYPHVLAYDPIFGYPSPDNMGFVDLYPEPNSSTPELIEVYISEFGSLNFQPFTFFRGGLLEGSTEERHLLQITNNGTHDCTQVIWELVFLPSNRFVHMNGQYDFGAQGCMMFHRDATLEVAAGSTMNYGCLGVGMLGLFEGAHVVLNHGSTLHIDNTVALWELDWLDSSQEIEIALPEGALLSFGDYAAFAPAPDGFKIKLLMQGGAVDFGGLDTEERALFELIWEESDNPLPLAFIGNPTQHPVFAWETLEDGPLTLTVVDARGRVVAQEQHSTFSGSQNIALTAILKPGAYTLVATQKAVVRSGHVIVH